MSTRQCIAAAATAASPAWIPVRPELVVEVAYDHVSEGRFRHGVRFLRWRPEKAPEQCLLTQIAAEPER